MRRGSAGPDGPSDTERILLLTRELATQLHPQAPLPPVRLRSRLDADLGIDSLALVEFRSRVEHLFGVTLGDVDALAVTLGPGLIGALLIGAGVVSYVLSERIRDHRRSFPN